MSVILEVLAVMLVAMLISVLWTSPWWARCLGPFNHKWEKWTDTTITRYPEGFAVVSSAVECTGQVRVCLECGRKTIRSI